MFHDFVKYDDRVPAEGVFEEKDGYRLLIEMAGFKKDDVYINVVGDYLFLEAEKKPSEKPTLRKSKISRKYFLDSKTLDCDSMTAVLEDGILEIFIPKYKKVSRKIEIQ
jgi:HSP20 family molecular chaperone IbpA